MFTLELKEEKDLFEFDEIISIEEINENILVYDIKLEDSLYPYYFANSLLSHNSMYSSIFQTFNMSPDTLDLNGDININGVRFTSKRQGLIPQVFQELLAKRKFYEKIRDLFPADSQEWYVYKNYEGGVKQIANSFYGITGYTRFRLYNPAVTRTVTFIGRNLIAFIWKKSESQGYKLLYGDTDSLFVSLGDDSTEDQAIKNAKELEKLINTSFPEFTKRFELVSKSFLNVDCEKIFSKVIFTGVKKKYIGFLFYKKGQRVNELFYRGIELVKRDTPKAFKVFLEKLVRMLFEEDSKPLVYAKQFKVDVQKNYKLQEIAVLKNISRRLDTYVKTTPQHIKAARFSNATYKTNFDKGDSVGIIYVKSRVTSVIGIDEEFTELPRGVVIDWDMYFKNFVDSKLETFSFLPQLKVQHTLFDFVGKSSGPTSDQVELLKSVGLMSERDAELLR